MYLPTLTEPVKVIRSQSGSVIMASPMVDGLPVTTDSISGGRPASYSTSASANAVSGVSSVGLSTTRLLVAIAGASLCDTMLSGWLNGVIAEITSPSGWLVVEILGDLPCAEISQA